MLRYHFHKHPSYRLQIAPLWKSCIFVMIIFVISVCQEKEPIPGIDTLSSLTDIEDAAAAPSQPAQTPSMDEPLREEASTAESFQLSLPQSIQENSYYCGPASLQMILRYKRIDKSQQELAGELHTSPITGTEYADMARVLNTYLFDGDPVDDLDGGYRVQTLSRYDSFDVVADTFEQRVRFNTEHQYPTLVAIDLHALYPELPKANHVVVCIGYKTQPDSDEIAYYYILDPYDKVQDAQYGGLKVFTSQELVTAILENEEPAYVW